MNRRLTVTPVLLGFLFWCCALAGLAVAADPVVRASLQSKGTLYVGQQVLIDVDVLVPNYFLQPPQFPQFDLPGATVLLQDGQALNLNETIGETLYSGIQRTYIVVPQRDGTFTLPQAEITFGYAAVPGQMTQGKVSLPQFRFTVTAASGAAEGASGVVAAKVAVTQDLSTDPKTLKAGDTLVRTITVRAEGLRAMMIPAPEFSPLPGIRLYQQDPVLSEETDPRGLPLAGVRKDVVQYLFSKVGQYTLPAIEVSWFDPVTAKTETVSAPAISASVAEAPVAATGLAPPAPEPEAPRFNWFLAGMIATFAFVTGLVIWLLAQALSKLEQSFERRRSDDRHCEAASFRLVDQACEDGSSMEIEKALDSWSRQAGIVPLRPWVAQFGSAQTLQAFDDQRQAVYGAAATPAVASGGLGSGLQAARAAWLSKAHPRSTYWHGKILPQLNPRWDGE